MKNLKQQKTKVIGFLFLFIASISTSVWSQQIVKPWRASSAIVKSGEIFEVWFNANSGQTVNSIELVGPYQTVAVSQNITVGSWEYDQWSENTYNQKITVTVPENAPADRYDLVLKTSQGEVTSLAAVKVITAYKKKFYVLHISDVHRWQTRSGGNYSLPEVSAIIDVANVIDPEMIIETGDNHYPNGSGVSDDHPKSTNTRIVNYMNGTSEYKGMNDFHAAVFTVPGNHDAPQKSYYLEPGYDENDLSGPWIKNLTKNHWNKNYGVQNHNFKYGNTRFMGINNAWCPDGGEEHAPNNTPNYLWQINDAIDWLDKGTVGAGKLRVSFYHVPQEGVPQFYNRLKDNNVDYTSKLVLAGHIHRTHTNPYTYKEAKIFTTGTARDGQEYAPFNLYQIDDETGIWTPVGNPEAAHQAIENQRDYNSQKIKLSYSKLNNGSFNNNSATVDNKFSFKIEDGRIRFVMPKGDDYVINNGTITQQFDGDDFRIIDVKVDLDASSVTTVNVYPVSGEYNHAEFISQDIPTLIAGQKATISLTMKNTGTTTWTIGNYFLGSRNPQDNSNWGINRVPLNEGENILPTEEKTFAFEVDATDDKGTYFFEWQMTQEGVEWFGDRTETKTAVFGSSEDFFDDCDSKTGWKPGALTLAETDIIQGDAALQSNGSSTDEFKKSFSTPYNANGTESGTVLQFWYYVSDPSKFISTNQVEISSSGGPDANEYNWNLSDGLNAGWNFIQLNTKDAVKIGNPDLSAINWFRLYRKKNGSVTTRIDAIELIGENNLTTNDTFFEKSFTLFPNPADTAFSVNFSLSNSASVSITLMNINGQLVSQRIHELLLSAGNHTLEVPVNILNPGIYFARIKIDDTVFTKRIIVK
tara:strand:- start:2312 stop:4912 length:2601 start_codon:yes stop_codon:yes gene_type:complete